MNADERRRYDMLVRVKQFGDDNAADFPAGTVAATQFAKVDAEVASTESKGASQAVGFGQAAQEYDVKGTARENLRELMSEITRTARSMEYAFDGIHEKFRMPRNRNDAELLNTARAFAIEAVQYNADFQAYGLAATFIADLTAAADAFEAAFSTTAQATAQHVAATAETAEHIRQGMIAVRTLDGIVKNKYANNVGKLAAWISASHVEKAPQKKPPPTP